MAGTMDVAVPAYFYPLEAPELWRRLTEHAARLRFVVVNPGSGVGAGTDPAYLAVIARLRTAGVRTIGYVDTDYGARSAAAVTAEAIAWRERYGVDGLFLDQVAAGLEHLSAFEDEVARLRAEQVRFIVANHGCYPHPRYLDLINVAVTFEGRWDAYRSLQVPAWARERPAERFCHLVYAVPRQVAGQPGDAVRDRHVGSACLTESRPPNPWDRLPTVLDRTSSRPERGRRPMMLR